MSYYQKANYKVFINNDSETAAAVAKEYLAYFAQFTNFSEYTLKINGKTKRKVPALDAIGKEILIECVFGEVVGGHLGCEEIDAKVNDLNNGSYAVYLYDSDHNVDYETYGDVCEKQTTKKPEKATCWGTGAMADVSITLPAKKWAKLLECDEEEIADTAYDLDEDCLSMILGSDTADLLFQSSTVTDVDMNKLTVQFSCAFEWDNFWNDGDAEGFCEAFRKVIASIKRMNGKILLEVGECNTLEDNSKQNWFLSNDDAHCVMSIVTGENMIQNPLYYIFE